MRIDPPAAIVPYNQDPAQAIALPLLLCTTPYYMTMMNFTLMNWGKPSKCCSKLALSFYIASAILTPDLLQLKQSCHFQNVVKMSKFNMLQHNLLQTDSKALAFFSGKSSGHTWRGDLSDRLQMYMDIYLQSSWYWKHFSRRLSQLYNAVVVSPRAPNSVSSTFTTQTLQTWI